MGILLKESTTIDRIHCNCGYTLKNNRDLSYTDDKILKLFSDHIRIFHIGGVENIAIKKKVVN